MKKWRRDRKGWAIVSVEPHKVRPVQHHPRPWSHAETAGGKSRIVYDATGRQIAVILSGGATGFTDAEMLCDSVNRCFPP